MDLQSNLLNFAYMLTGSRDDAYDLLQDTTLKALDNEAKYVDNTNFKGWVFTIMRNIFIAINSFPDCYRIPFSMHVAGYKYNEIADEMHLPLGTIKSRIFFARKKLQERFADYR